MADMVRVDVNTDVEAYPVLGINAWDERSNGGRDTRVPTEMLDRLLETEHAVEQAQIEIMRYLAERHEYTDIRDWVAEHTWHEAHDAASGDATDRVYCAACGKTEPHSLRHE